MEFLVILWLGVLVFIGLTKESTHEAALVLMWLVLLLLAFVPAVRYLIG